MAKIKTTTVRPTLSSLAPRPHTIKLNHPVYGEQDATITIVGFDSREYLEAVNVLRIDMGERKMSDLTQTEFMEYNAKLLSFLVKEWDEDFFEKELTLENAAQVLGDPNNKWVVKQIEEACEDKQRFFPQH